MSMFAKLKKKIADEGGSVTDGEKSFLPPPVPGHASPIRRSSSTAMLPQGSSNHSSKDAGDSGMGGAASPTSQSSEDSMREDSSREEIVTMLLKRTEQCRKLESKISEYAAMVKDRNKMVEKLELVVEKQEDVTNNKLTNLAEELKTKHEQLLSTITEEMDDKLKSLQKENTELSSSLRKEEGFKHKLFQREEEQDEVQGLAAQELAKVKHMLILTQEQLSELQTDLATQSSLHSQAEKSLKEMKNKLTTLKARAAQFEKENERLLEVSSQQVDIIRQLTSEKSVFEKRLDEVNSDLTTKQNQLAKLTTAYSDLENNHKTLQRTSDIHKNKTSQLLTEKHDQVEQLEERVNLLEQRTHDHALTGDERLKALEMERDGLEHKVYEGRQQLTEIKSTWSDKISHLELQISHLNTKIAEDNEDMMSTERAGQNMRDNFHKQLDDLRHKLEDAEKRVLESWELASQKDRQYDRQRRELEHDLQKGRLNAVDSETQLRSKITSLEMQMSELETKCDLMKNESEQTIAHMESLEQEHVEEQLRLQKCVKMLEADLARTRSELTERVDERASLQLGLQEMTESEASLRDQVSGLDVEIQRLSDSLVTLKKDYKLGQTDFKQCEKEKDELMMRNAELSQQTERWRQESTERERHLEAEVGTQVETITSLQRSELEMEERFSHLKKKFEDSETQRSVDQTNTATVGDLQSDITLLQNQLSDKNRALKKQEQTLKDLRITLQRELKVQALPNDYSSDHADSHSPTPNRKFDSNKRIQLDTNSGASLFSTTSARYGTGSRSLHVQNTATGILMQDDAKLRIGTLGIRQELDKDVNFQYLKHVILKFLLSRESESTKLVKAISMLLHFSREEQELIKQTLEWKMSWFGSRPSLGKGQTSKVIPPTY